MHYQIVVFKNRFKLMMNNTCKNCAKPAEPNQVRAGSCRINQSTKTSTALGERTPASRVDVVPLLSFMHLLHRRILPLLPSSHRSVFRLASSLAVMNILTSASGNTVVPMSLPSITTLFLRPAMRSAIDIFRDKRDRQDRG